jgi:predicted transposase YbfD/YdcC
MTRLLWDALGDVPDRRGRQGRQYELRSVLGIALAAMLAGANDLRAIWRWGRRLRPEALRLFGIESGRSPCHASYHYFFQALDADALAATLGRYARGEATGGHIALDGKTLRGSRRLDAAPLHVLSAFATELGAVIGDLVVPPEANEITAALTLLKGLPLEGAIVTGDAIFAQREICRHVRDAEGHSLFVVKTNQPELHRDIAIAFGDASPCEEPPPMSPGPRRWEKGHGRIETRKIAVSREIVPYLAWPGLARRGSMPRPRRRPPPRIAAQPRHHPHPPGRPLNLRSPRELPRGSRQRHHPRYRPRSLNDPGRGRAPIEGGSSAVVVSASPGQGTRSTEGGQVDRTMGCEPELVADRPCDPPGCAVSAESLVVVSPACSWIEREEEWDASRRAGHTPKFCRGGHDRGRSRAAPGRGRSRPREGRRLRQEARTRNGRPRRGDRQYDGGVIVAHVKRVVIANPLQVRAIAHAKVKTDRIDAVVLAKLHAAGFLPEVWQPDDATERLRRQVAHRASVVQARTRLKNRIYSVLHANLILPYRGDLFSGKKRAWLAAQPIDEDERVAIDSWLLELDRLGEPGGGTATRPAGARGPRPPRGCRR